MILGIDAHCNRGVASSVTYLRSVLSAVDPAASGFSRVIIWSASATLDSIEDREWLVKVHVPTLEKGLAKRSLWSASKVTGLARDAGCDVLWLPGCSFAGGFRPFVAMSHNMLPFEWRELRRYVGSPRLFKFLALRYSQSRTYRNANGMIYLTEYARKRVSAVCGRPESASCVIPHGIDARFASPVDQGAHTGPWRLLYVSSVDLYKHQWRVVEAVSQLQASGVDAELALIGPSWPDAERKLRHALERCPTRPGSVKYLGVVPHDELHRHYQAADIFVYASSCENLPLILLEAMASAKPIACSSMGPMPEVLKDGGVYFDPENASSIAATVRRLIDSPELRAEKAALAAAYSKAYTWTRCARDTFDYLARIGAEHHTP